MKRPERTCPSFRPTRHPVPSIEDVCVCAFLILHVKSTWDKRGEGEVKRSAGEASAFWRNLLNLHDISFRSEKDAVVGLSLTVYIRYSSSSAYTSAHRTCSSSSTPQFFVSAIPTQFKRSCRSTYSPQKSAKAGVQPSAVLWACLTTTPFKEKNRRRTTK